MSNFANVVLKNKTMFKAPDVRHGGNNQVIALIVFKS